MRKWLGVIGIAFALIILCGLIFIRGYHGPPAVYLHNHTSRTITDVHLEGQGWTYNLDELPPGMTHVCVVFPTGDSSCSISYTVGASEYKKDLDVYIEPLGGYVLIITVILPGEVEAEHGLSVFEWRRVISFQQD